MREEKQASKAERTSPKWAQWLLSCASRFFDRSSDDFDMLVHMAFFFFFFFPYGIWVGCALCKVTGFNGASIAFLAGSMTCSNMGGAFTGVFHPLIQVVMWA